MGIGAIEETGIDGLAGGEDGGAEDIIDVSAAANFGAGFLQADDQLAVSACSGDYLEHFGGDIAGVEIGKDEDIGAAGDEAIAETFLLGDLRIEGGVELEFPLKIGIEINGGGFGLGDGEGLSDFENTGMGGFAGVGGEAEEGDPRGSVGQVGHADGGGDGDISQLGGIGIGDNAAIGEEEESLLADCGIFLIEDHHGGGGFDGRLGGDDAEEGAQSAGRGGGGSADQGIDTAGQEHEGGEVMAIEEKLFLLVEGEIGEVGNGFQHGQEEIHIVASFRFEDPHSIEADIEEACIFLNAGPIAEEDGDATLAGDDLSGGLKDARVATFGEDDAFGVVAELLVEGFEEGHGGRKD